MKIIIDESINYLKKLLKKKPDIVSDRKTKYIFNIKKKYAYRIKVIAKCSKCNIERTYFLHTIPNNDLCYHCSHIGIKPSDEIRKKRSISCKRMWTNKEYRNKVLSKTKWNDSEFQRKNKNDFYKTEEGKECKKRISETVRKTFKEKNLYQYISNKNKELWKDKEYLKKYFIGKYGKEDKNFESWIKDEYPIREYKNFDNELKIYVRDRFGNLCVNCGVHESNISRSLDCHHIDYDKKNYSKNNIVPLCQSCHCKTNYNRAHWIKKLKEIIDEKRKTEVS